MAQIRSKQISDFLSSIQWANVVSSDNVKIANAWDIKQGFDTVDASVNSLESFIAGEVSSLEAVDTALSAEIVTEKERVDAILDSAEADKDSFAEIVSLINAVDTENDNAFASFVLRTDKSIDSLEQVDKDLQGQITSNDTDILGLQGDVTSLDTRVLGVEGDLAAEITRAGSVESALSAELAAEIATTNGEVNVINASIDSLEVAVEEGGTYLRQTAVFTATNLFTLPQPVAFGTNDDLTVYVNGVFVDFRCSGGTDIDFTGLLAYDVDAKDKVQVMGIKA